MRSKMKEIKAWLCAFPFCFCNVLFCFCFLLVLVCCGTWFGCQGCRAKIDVMHDLHMRSNEAGALGSSALSATEKQRFSPTRANSVAKVFSTLLSAIGKPWAVSHTMKCVENGIRHLAFL